jgi:hypothetical protein
MNFPTWWLERKNKPEDNRESGVNPDPIHPLPDLEIKYIIEICLKNGRDLVISYSDEQLFLKRMDELYKRLTANNFISDACKLTFMQVGSSIIRVSNIDAIFTKKVEK